MRVDCRLEGGRLIVTPEGPALDLCSASAFREAVGEHLSATARVPGAITVDLRYVRFLDSAGLGALISLLKRSKRCGVPLSLRSVEGEVRSVLDVTLMSRIFEIEDPVEAAAGERTGR